MSANQKSMWTCAECNLRNKDSRDVCCACFTRRLTPTKKTKTEEHRTQYTVTYDDNDTKSEESLPQLDRKPIRIYLDGCWDMCHSGHYNAIRQAKQLGDILVMGCHSDEEIALHKRTPVMNNEERVGALEACKWVDEVVFGVPYTIREGLLEELNCDFVAHGDDVPKDKDGNSAYHLVEDRLKIFKRTPGVSTTALISKLLTVDSRNMTASMNPPAPSSWTQFLSTSRRISQFSNASVPQTGDIVVYVDGVFDLFHIGHISFLKAAKEFIAETEEEKAEADRRNVFVYCGIYGDQTVAAIKGANFPLMSLQERTLCVLSCKYVDEVVIGCPLEITRDMLNAMNVDYVLTARENGDYELSAAPPSRYDVAKRDGIHREVGEATVGCLKTDSILDRIRENRDEFVKTNKEKEKKERSYLDSAQYVTES